MAVEELRQKLISEISLMLLAVGGLATCLYPADSPRLWGHFIIFLSLLLQGIAGYLLHRTAPLVARAILLLGPTLSLARAVAVMGSPSLPYFPVLIVLANSAISPLSGLLAAILNTATLLAMLPLRTLPSPLALIWLAAAIQWLLLRELDTAVEWSENSEQRAVRLLQELRERQGQLNRTLVALTEATRRLERANRELAVARRHAEEARSMREQFVANVSHELRTPLNLIVGFAEMMYLAPETYEGVRWTPELESDIGRMYRASRHLQGLVDDILDLSRIDACRLPMFRALQDIGPVIGDALETIAPVLRQRGLAYEAAYPDGLPQLFIDRTRIRQVLLNLLNNAARFTDAGKITVRAEQVGDSVWISVQDTGIGLPEEQLERVFEKFHQVGPSAGSRGGTGLGLAISQQFVQLHGGRMWVESRLGVGSTFYFSLPLPGAVPEAAPLHYIPHPRGHERSDAPVVVLDSDLSIADMLSRYLGDRTVLGARDAAEVEALIEVEHPWAVIINEAPDTPPEGWLRSPGELSLRYDVPVFHCSIPSGGWLSRSGGFADCLTKPVSLESLRATVARFCRERGTILVVDDDPGFVSLITRMLGTMDLAGEVLSAYTGSEAVRLARERAPDLVLMDLLMPEMDGFDAAEAIHQDPALAKTVVVAITASSYAEEAMLRGGGHLVLTQARGISTGTLTELLSAALQIVRPSYAVEESTDSSA